MRHAIQAALLRIQQHTQSLNTNDPPGLSASPLQVCSRSKVLSYADVPVSNGTGRITVPDMRLVVQYLGKPDFRGTINAMVRLIEEYGILKLQRVGVLSQEGALRSQEIAVIANAYSIPIHVVTSKGSDSNGGSEACLHGMSLGVDQLALDLQQEARSSHTEWQKAIPFPKRDDMDVIHGYGTIALDFERKLATPAQGSPTRPCGLKSTPDFIIGDMDNGITLSGICMAFAGTRTRVLGAAPMSGFWECALKQYSSDIPLEGNYEYKYWEGIDVPMAAIPWATFRAPGNLSGVFEVDNEQMYSASIAAREHYNLYLDPDEVVPLAVALYNEDFRRLVAQAWRQEENEDAGGKEDGPTVGIILRSRRADRLVPFAINTC